MTRPLLLAAALLAAGCSPDFPYETPDGPAPSRAQLVAAFGDVTLGTVQAAERDLDGPRCAFDSVMVNVERIEARGADRYGVSVYAADPDGLIPPNRGRPPELWLYASRDGGLAPGDTLRASVVSSACGAHRGETERLTVHLVEVTPTRIAAVFAGDLGPIRDIGGTYGRSYRLLGGFNVPADTSAATAP